MKADKGTARRLAELSVQARLERLQLQKEILEIKQHPHVALGATALHAAKGVGLNNPKLLFRIAKSVVLPAGLAVGRLLLKKSSPRRVIGGMALLAMGIAVAKGIQYDEWKKIEKNSVEPNLLPAPEADSTPDAKGQGN